MSRFDSSAKCLGGRSSLALMVCVGLLATLVLGCGDAARSLADPQPSVAATPSPNPWLTEANIARAIDFRTSFGLRADEAWVRRVAADPAANPRKSRYGIPLTPSEVAELVARAATTGALTDVVQAYGVDHPDDFVDVFVDAAQGRVIAQFAREIERHEAALRKLVAPDAPLDVEAVQYTHEELQVLFDRVVHDGWLDERGYDLLDAGINTRANRVELYVSTADPDAVQTIAAHYDAGPMFEVTTDGIGWTQLPRGTLRGVAVDAHGTPVPALVVRLQPDVPPGTRLMGGPPLQTETTARGRFELDVPALGYEVTFHSQFGRDGRYLEFVEQVQVGQSRTEVIAEAVTVLVVEVEPLYFPDEDEWL